MKLSGVTLANDMVKRRREWVKTYVDIGRQKDIWVGSRRRAGHTRHRPDRRSYRGPLASGQPWVTVKVLIDNGFITAPATLHGERNGMLFEVSLEVDGTFTWKDRRFSSPSLAAGQLITLATNDRTPGRGYFSVNGWKFWSSVARTGAYVPCARSGAPQVIGPDPQVQRSVGLVLVRYPTCGAEVVGRERR